MSRSPKLVLAACCLTMLGVGENSTAIMAALPAMTAELKLEAATVEWIVNAYLLASAVFIVLGGEAADRFGAARSSAAGIALFALASLVIALAPDGRTVVAARALQGIGAAFAVPGTLAAVTHEHSRVRSPAGHRRLDRLPDARLQHRAADRRGAHALRRLAGDVLAQPAADGARWIGAVAAPARCGRPPRPRRLARACAARGVHGRARAGTARGGSSRVFAGGRDRSARPRGRRVGRASSGWKRAAARRSSTSRCSATATSLSPAFWRFC